MFSWISEKKQNLEKMIWDKKLKPKWNVEVKQAALSILYCYYSTFTHTFFPVFKARRFQILEVLTLRTLPHPPNSYSLSLQMSHSVEQQLSLFRYLIQTRRFSLSLSLSPTQTDTPLLTFRFHFTQFRRRHAPISGIAFGLQGREIVDRSSIQLDATSQIWITVYYSFHLRRNRPR